MLEIDMIATGFCCACASIRGIVKSANSITAETKRLRTITVFLLQVMSTGRHVVLTYRREYLKLLLKQELGFKKMGRFSRKTAIFRRNSLRGICPCGPGTQRIHPAIEIIAFVSAARLLGSSLSAACRLEFTL